MTSDQPLSSLFLHLYSGRTDSRVSTSRCKEGWEEVARIKRMRRASSKPEVLRRRRFCPPGDIWPQCLGTLLVVSWGRGCATDIQWTQARTERRTPKHTCLPKSYLVPKVNSSALRKPALQTLSCYHDQACFPAFAVRSSAAVVSWSLICGHMCLCRRYL